MPTLLEMLQDKNAALESCTLSDFTVDEFRDAITYVQDQILLGKLECASAICNKIVAIYTNLREASTGFDACLKLLCVADAFRFLFDLTKHYSDENPDDTEYTDKKTNEKKSFIEEGLNILNTVRLQLDDVPFSQLQEYKSTHFESEQGKSYFLKVLLLCSAYVLNRTYSEFYPLQSFFLELLNKQTTSADSIIDQQLFAAVQLPFWNMLGRIKFSNESLSSNEVYLLKKIAEMLVCLPDELENSMAISCYLDLHDKLDVMGSFGSWLQAAALMGSQCEEEKVAQGLIQSCKERLDGIKSDISDGKIDGKVLDAFFRNKQYLFTDLHRSLRSFQSDVVDTPSAYDVALEECKNVWDAVANDSDIPLDCEHQRRDAFSEVAQQVKQSTNPQTLWGKGSDQEKREDLQPPGAKSKNRCNIS